MDWIRQLCLIRLLAIVRRFKFYWWSVADGTQQPALVEPVHPFQRRKFHVSCTTPALSFNDFRLVQANDAFRQCVVVGAADRTHRCLHACLLQSCAVTQRQVLAAAVAVVRVRGCLQFTHSGNQTMMQPKRTVLR